MRKILLIGNPNVGKSVFFSRLTGIEVVSSNYPGTTVEYTKGYMLVGDEKVEIIDVPGTYTLSPTCKAEEVACRMIADGDVIINIVDATNLERNLYLTLELMEQKVPIIVALNFSDEAEHKGIKIDAQALAKWLAVPVVPTVAVTGQGFAMLTAEIFRARTPAVRQHSLVERWEDVGKLISRVQKIEQRRHTLLEWFQDLTIKPLTGLPFALVIALLSFAVVRFIGEGLINYLMNPLFNSFYTPLLMKLSQLLGGGGFWHDIVVGRLINGSIDYFQSFGLLSTGIYIELGAVLPYIISFYLVLGLLEDSGYLPRLAVLLDTFLHRLGLHGFAIVPTILGFGCNVPGIMATRILESKRERFIASTLISIGVPCSALQAMIIGVLGHYGVRPLLTVYLSLFVSWIVLGFILNRVLPGFSPELLLEIPPYRLPPLKIVFTKLKYRIKAFLLEAFPIVLAGVGIVNLLYLSGLFNLVANMAAPVVSGLLGLPKAAVMPIVIGFLRKDVAMGMLLPLELTVKQLIIASVVLSMFFPCIATFVVLLRELGAKETAKATAIMIAASLLVGGLLNFIL